jgi:hypothetical protein
MHPRSSLLNGVLAPKRAAAKIAAVTPRVRSLSFTESNDIIEMQPFYGLFLDCHGDRPLGFPRVGVARTRVFGVNNLVPNGRLFTPSLWPGKALKSAAPGVLRRRGMFPWPSAPAIQRSGTERPTCCASRFSRQESQSATSAKGTKTRE